MLSFLYSPPLTSIHDYWKTIALTRWTFVGKAISLLFNVLSRLVITFLSMHKCLFRSCSHHLQWFCSPPKESLSLFSIVSPFICHEVMRPDAMILVFWMLSFGQLFHSPLSLSSRGSLVLLHFCHKCGAICIFLLAILIPACASHSPACLMMCPAYKYLENLSSGHRTGKGQFSFQSQRNAMPRNV